MYRFDLYRNNNAYPSDEDVNKEPGASSALGGLAGAAAGAAAVDAAAMSDPFGLNAGTEISGATFPYDSATAVAAAGMKAGKKQKAKGPGAPPKDGKKGLPKIKKNLIEPKPMPVPEGAGMSVSEGEGIDGEEEEDGLEFTRKDGALGGKGVGANEEEEVRVF